MSTIRFSSEHVPSGKNRAEKLFVVTVRRKLVHLVEDDGQLRRLLGQLLRSSGFGVEKHESGGMFLARSDRIAPPCVLVDINVPGAIGFAGQGAVRERGRGKAMVVALKAGASDLRTRPFDRAEPLSRIDQRLQFLPAEAGRGGALADAAP